MKLRNILLAGVLVCGGISFFSACQEEGIVVNSNDVSYVGFKKDRTVDTTAVCFRFYALEEGADVKVAEVPIEVTVCGKVQCKDLEFTISIDETLSTLPKSQCVLPERCVIKNGQLIDTIYVKVKSSPDLEDKTKILALKVNPGGEVAEGIFVYSRAFVAVTDRLFKPDWWSFLDLYDGTESSVDWYYLGTYSEKKYEMFLEELQKDNVVFDGKDRQVLRKYSLRLKYRLKELSDAGTPAYDENDELITVPIGG